MRIADINLSGVPYYVNYVAEVKDENTLVLSFYNLFYVGKEWNSFIVKYGDAEIIVPASIKRRAIFEQKFNTKGLKLRKSPTINFFQSAKSFDKLEDTVKLQIEYNRKVQGENYTFLEDKDVKNILNDDEHNSTGFALRVLAKRVSEAMKVLIPGAYKADILRYYLLYTRGGVWLDDKSSLRFPVNDEFFSLDVYDGFLVSDHRYLGVEIGFMGAKKNHPFVKELLLKSLDNIEKRLYQSSALTITGPNLVNNMLKDVIGSTFNEYSFEYKGMTIKLLHSELGLIIDKYHRPIWTHDHDHSRGLSRRASKSLYTGLWKSGNIYTDDNSDHRKNYNITKSIESIVPLIIIFIFLFCWGVVALLRTSFLSTP